MRRAWLGLALTILAGPGCGGDRSEARDDAGRDGADASPGCAAGTITCEGGRAVRCDERGAPAEETTCSGPAPVCVEGLGCAACRPGARRCGGPPDAVPELCGEDGAGFVAETPCDAEAGLVCSDGACVDLCARASARRSYLGCDYWAATTSNVAHTFASAPFAVAIANSGSATVAATIDGGGLTEALEVEVPADDVRVVELPWVTALSEEHFASALVAGGGYHIRTDAPVTVVQFNPLTFQDDEGNATWSNDASLLLPTTAVDQRYTVVTYPKNDQYLGVGGLIAVVATAASTTEVRVTLTESVHPGEGVDEAAAGDELSFELERGDVLQLLGSGDGDLTGTRVDSSAPVVVFGGHVCAEVPLLVFACDHLEEQLFPDTAWGNTYAVTAFQDRPEAGSVVRILSLTDDNTITFEPADVHAAAELSAGAFLELQTADDFVVSGSSPILVAQYMVGMGLAGGSVGDPALVLEVPVEQYRDEYVFYVPDTYTSSWINIVGPADRRPILDDEPAPEAGLAIAGSGLARWSFALEPGVHRIAGDGREVVRFGIKLYGVAPNTSYAYPGGLDLAPLTIF